MKHSATFPSFDSNARHEYKSPTSEQILLVLESPILNLSVKVNSGSSDKATADESWTHGAAFGDEMPEE